MDIKLTQQQFNRFRHLVYRECGINLHDGKQALLTARLVKRLRQTRIQGVEDYLGLLEIDERERILFFDAISTNHTFFFREDRHFECLTQDHKTIWCCAASSGEEPYSVAIQCLEIGFRPHILATDISTKVLKIGEAGIYPIEKMKNIPLPLVKKYFQKGTGKWKNHIRVKRHLRNLVHFQRFNLLTDQPPRLQFNVIFCRNVLIYFDHPVKQKVIDRLYPALKWDGYFIIGGAESLNNVRHRYRYLKPSLFLKARGDD